MEAFNEDQFSGLSIDHLGLVADVIDDLQLFDTALQLAVNLHQPFGKLVALPSQADLGQRPVDGL